MNCSICKDPIEFDFEDANKLFHFTCVHTCFKCSIEINQSNYLKLNNSISNEVEYLCPKCFKPRFEEVYG